MVTQIADNQICRSQPGCTCNPSTMLKTESISESVRVSMMLMSRRGPLPLNSAKRCPWIHVVRAQEAIVRAANSYTSYKEMWAEALDLDKTERGVPMVVMEAAMVRLPFAAASGTDSLLRTIVEADVPVETYGSETLKAIIAFKWQEFARKQVGNLHFVT